MKRIVAVLSFVVLGLVPSVARAQECKGQVWTSVQKLQPWYYRGVKTADVFSRRSKHLIDLTSAVCSASTETKVEPLIAVSIGMRESSLLPFVGLGKKNGLKGERGYWQVMPDGRGEKLFAPEGCSQHDPSCNATTAFRMMAHHRDTCPGGSDPWIWVAAYGLGHCVDAEAAREDVHAKVARRYYCEIEPNCADTWPE